VTVTSNFTEILPNI